MRKTLVLGILAGVAIAATSQSLPDADYILPMDTTLELPSYGNPKLLYRADTISTEGAYYQGYFIITGFTYDTKLGFTGPYIYSKADISLHEDGFYYFDANYEKNAEPMLLLSGGDTFLAFPKLFFTRPEAYFYGNADKADGEGSFVIGGPRWAYYRFSMGEEERADRYRSAGSGLWHDGIKSITAWSTLEETSKGVKTRYGIERTRHPFYAWGDAGININNAALFWAEGEPGPGIGGTIDIELARPSDHLMVLNGAVDLARRHLYKANNRLKRILVRSEEPAYAFEYVFEDSVQYHKIELPRETTKLTLTILDVYKGSKWDDTCVTKIFLKQPPQVPRGEYDEAVRSYIYSRKLDKLIAEYERRRGGKTSVVSSGEDDPVKLAGAVR